MQKCLFFFDLRSVSGNWQPWLSLITCQSFALVFFTSVAVVVVIQEHIREAQDEGLKIIENSLKNK